MRFFQNGLPAVEWDVKNERPLFAFERRLFETDDPDLIKHLKKQGYLVIDGDDQVSPNIKGASTAAPPPMVRKKTKK